MDTIKTLFKRYWTTCPRFVNISKLNSEHNRGGPRGLLMAYYQWVFIFHTDSKFLQLIHGIKPWLIFASLYISADAHILQPSESKLYEVAKKKKNNQIKAYIPQRASKCNTLAQTKRKREASKGNANRITNHPMCLTSKRHPKIVWNNS